jgi:cysteine desulfurase/selenocysteine lyase
MLETGASGLPDIAWLTRLANEMFRSQPDSPVPFAAFGGIGAPAPSTPLPPGSPAEVPQPPNAAAALPGTGTALPGESDTRSVPASPPPQAVGGFGASPVSTPLPPTSEHQMPQPSAAAVSVPAAGVAIPGEAELRGLLGSPPPNAVGGFGAAPPSTPLPGLPALGTANPGEAELRGLPGLSQPGSTGGYGVSPFDRTPLFDLSALDTSNPGDDALRALLGGVPASPAPAAAPAPEVSPGAPAPSLYFLEEANHGGVPAAAATPASPAPAYDANARRADFPILSERVNGRPLIWLDNGATTQKPRSVIDRLTYFYEHENSNIHRAAHTLAARSTDAYEGARETVRRFLHASSVDEIVFVRGTTEAINLVAQSWGRKYIGKGDEIVISWLEHHANIVPWQMLCEETGAKLRVAPVDDDGQVILEAYGALLNQRTKLVAFSQVSNALGTITPSTVMTAMAHAVGARVLLDGAQSVSHMRTDVQSIGCDWFVFSGHKIFAPTGIGALYGRTDVLEESPPWQGGGNMIKDVTFEHTEYHRPPTRFEAGTGNIADAVGLGVALDYVEQVGLEAISAYEHELLLHATHLLNQIPGLRLLGTAREKAGVLSFVIDGMDTMAIGKALNEDGIAVRAGHHCAQPILRRMGVESSVRASLALYNTHSDVEALATSLRRIRSGKVAMV